MSSGEAVPFSIFWRFYIYALHGYATEVMFTAAWEFVVNINWKFPGNSSVWSFFIYGICSIFIERLYLRLKEKGVPLLIRGLIYTAASYSFEFTTGFILRQFDACPWDYTPFDGDFMGLVTLEYLPLWYVANLLMDLILIPLTLQLHWGPKGAITSATSNGDLKCKTT